MNIKQLAAKPKLIKVAIDSEQILSLYGEPLEFWMYDRQNIPTFMKIVALKDDQTQVFDLIKDVVLDEEGKKVLEDGEMLPIEVMVPVVEGIISKLGNLKPLTTQE